MQAQQLLSQVSRDEESIHPSGSKMVEKGACLWEIPVMDTIKADDYKRVRIPDALPGQVFEFKNNGDGTRTLTQIKSAEPVKGKVKWIKKNGYTVGHTDKVVSPETIKELLSDFP